MRKGSIVLVPFPFTDLSGKKVRPAVILYASAKGEDVIVAFISSVNPKRKSLYELPVSPSGINGLKTMSYIKLDKLATLQRNIVVGELGKVEPSLLKNINTKLSDLFAL